MMRAPAWRERRTKQTKEMICQAAREDKIEETKVDATTGGEP